jgi:hypothetical protein
MTFYIPVIATDECTVIEVSWMVLPTNIRGRPGNLLVLDISGGEAWLSTRLIKIEKEKVRRHWGKMMFPRILG